MQNKKMDFEEKISKVEHEYRNKQCYKTLYGWYFVDYLYILRKLKIIVNNLCHEFKEITFCGSREDIDFFRKHFGKLHKVHFLIFDDTLFKQWSQLYPIDIAERHISQIQGTACVITSTSRRWLEMAILQKKDMCIDIFDELRRSGIEIQDKNWNGHSWLKQIEKGGMKILSIIPIINKFFFVQSMLPYFESLEDDFEGGGGGHMCV